MADIEANREVWEQTWDWSTGGEEWSSWWGGSEALWYGALLPRIHSFIPAPRILEIAPGFGRWSRFLKDQCGELVLVDLAERCIESCRERFAGEDHIAYHVNDGRSLEMVADGSIDFAFSFDSLVHAELGVIEAYLGELSRVLDPDGVAFLHHSNIGQYRTAIRVARAVPDRMRSRLVERGMIVDLAAWRAESVTASLVRAGCEQAGLECITQERINWQHGRFLTDSLTVAARPGSRWQRDRITWDNRSYRKEADRMKLLYARDRKGEPR